MAIRDRLFGRTHHVDADETTASDDKEIQDQPGEHASLAPSTVNPVMRVEQAMHDAKAEHRVLRKLDYNLMPQVFLLLLLASLDRSNIGNAETAGMMEALSLDSGRYQWLLTIFYIAYIVFEVTILLYKFCPPHIVMATTTLIWGIAATLQASAQNWSGMMALRFILGAAEATVGPGIIYFLSFFYLRHELGFRCGMYFASAPLASTFAGALAYGLTSARNSKLASWRLLFLVEGIPTIIMAPFIFFFLPDSPPTAKFLNADEKKVAAARNVKQAGAVKRVGKPNWSAIGATFLDVKAWICAIMYFSMNTSYASLPVYLPTLLAEFGISSITAQGLTAPPYFLSFLVTIASTWSADRTRQRGLHIFMLSCIGGVGYILLATTEGTGPRYVGVFLAASGIFPAIANTLPWVMNLQSSDEGRGAGVTLLNLVGQCGPLLGTRLYPSSEGPHYTKGHAVCAGFLFFNALCALTLRTICWWENRKLDRRFGTVEEIRRRKAERGGKEGELVALENWSEEFRYQL